MLDFDLFTRVDRRSRARRSGGSTSSTTARRSCTSAPSRCASTSRPSSRTSTSTPAPTAWRSPRRRSRRLVHSGIDEVTFSIDGSSQETYVKYRQRGNFDKAHRQPAGAWPTRSAKSGRDVPFVNWRYILFNWNDSRRGDGARAADGGRGRRRSAVLGDHRSSRGLLLAALRARHAGLRAHPPRDLGHAAASATRFPARRRAPRSTSARCCPTCRSWPGRRTPVTLTTRVKNLSARPFRAQASYGRRLVRLGAQLMTDDGTMINRDYARAWLPGDLAPGGASRRARSKCPRPRQPGRYALKFDLVSEGIDWFEACGSPTITRGLWVRLGCIGAQVPDRCWCWCSGADGVP